MNRTERKIKKAFENATPNVLGPVLSQCQQQKGAVSPMKKKSRPLTKFVNIAASLGIVALLFGIGSVAGMLLFPDNPFTPGDSLVEPENPDVLEGSIDVPTGTTDFEGFNTLPPETLPEEYRIVFHYSYDEAKYIAHHALIETFPWLQDISHCVISGEYAEGGTPVYIFNVDIGGHEFRISVDEATGNIADSQRLLDGQWVDCAVRFDFITKEDAFNIARGNFSREFDFSDQAIAAGLLQDVTITLDTGVYNIQILYYGIVLTMDLDAITGEILSVNLPMEKDDTISKEAAIKVAMTDAGLYEDYMNGEYQVHCKLFDYDPLPLYYVCFNVMKEDIGYVWAYVIDGIGGEIMASSRDGQYPGDYLISPGTALDRLLDRMQVGFYKVTYLKLNTDAKPYYYISLQVDGAIYEVEIDAYTGEIRNIISGGEIDPPMTIDQEQVIKDALGYTECPDDRIENLTAVLEEYDDGAVWVVRYECPNCVHQFRIHAETGICHSMSSAYKLPGICGIEKAEEIALKDAGVSIKSSRFCISTNLRGLEDEPYYVVYFVLRGTEYRRTIDARTGEVLSRDEPVYTYGISEFEATIIALHTTGFTADEVDNLACTQKRFGENNEALSYVVSFSRDGYLYECWIGAGFGEILSIIRTN